MRSLLFVPADSERKLLKGTTAGADALTIDLEDSVLPARKATGREMLVEFAKTYDGPSELWVRVNDLTSGELLRDLATIAKVGPKGILLPKIRDRQDVETVQNYLTMAEEMGGLVPGSIKILLIATETPQIIMNMPSLAARPLERVVGLTWGAEDLSSAIGAGDPRAPDGSWRPPYQQVRSQCLFAAHAMEVGVMDTVFVDFRDPEGCRRSAETARHDGFTGKIAIHPDQIPIINAAFTPTADEIAFAQRVIAAFEGGAGSVSIDGKMFDVPHLKAAHRLLAAAAKKR